MGTMAFIRTYEKMHLSVYSYEQTLGPYELDL